MSACSSNGTILNPFSCYLKLVLSNKKIKCHKKTISMFFPIKTLAFPIKTLAFAIKTLAFRPNELRFYGAYKGAKKRKREKT